MGPNPETKLITWTQSSRSIKWFKSRTKYPRSNIPPLPCCIMNLHIQVELLYTWKSLWSPYLQDFSLLQVEKSKPNLHEASVQFAMNWALTVSFPLPLASLTMQDPKCDDVHIKTLMTHIKHLKKWNIRKHPITAVFFFFIYIYTCWNSNSKIDYSCDQNGQKGSFGDGHLWVLQWMTAQT